MVPPRSLALLSTSMTLTLMVPVALCAFAATDVTAASRLMPTVRQLFAHADLVAAVETKPADPKAAAPAAAPVAAPSGAPLGEAPAVESAAATGEKTGLTAARRVAVYELELQGVEPNIGTVVTDSLLAE